MSNAAAAAPVAAAPHRERMGAMSRGFAHLPVMLERVVEHVRAAAPRTILDCTLGGAGHALALLNACPEAELIGIDRDAEAVHAARERLGIAARRSHCVQARFAQAAEVLHQLGLERVDALVADLGVSSHQLDTAARGFSFRSDSLLDMRMDAHAGQPVWQWLHEARAEELADVLWRYGEERYARRIARAVVEQRPQTTLALAQLVQRVVPFAAEAVHPATRTFQALRIWVNNELGELEALLAALPQLLRPDGVAVFLSFHSLEDRAVKQAFRQAAKGCICPADFPMCQCGKQATLALVTRKAERPSSAEVAENPRARSVRLRAARRLRG